MLCHLILILYRQCNKNKPQIFKRFTVPVNRNDLFTLVATVLTRDPMHENEEVSTYVRSDIEEISLEEYGPNHGSDDKWQLTH